MPVKSWRVAEFREALQDQKRLTWLLEHALGDIEIACAGVVRSVRTRQEIDQAMSEEKPRAE
jgi:hypothetical protein